MAEARRLSNLGPLGLLIREQPTLRLAVETLARYGNRLNEALFLTVEEAGDVVVLREELIVGGSGQIRQSTELAIGVAFRILRIFLGADWRPRRVCFAHDAPADRSVHERVFGHHVEFGHDFNGIVCARSDLEIANPDADPGIARMARQMLEAAPASGAADMTSQVRELVVMLLPTGACTIDRAAQHLGIDRRTIHRHLAARGSDVLAHRGGYPRRACRALREGAASRPHRGLVAARILRAERLLALVPAALWREGVDATRRRAATPNQNFSAMT